MDINNLPIAKHVKEQIPLVINRFKIDNPKRLAHFLSQCAHESAGFTQVSEDLNYSKVRILEIFGRYFRTISPNGYDYNPVLLGNRVYANRMGNGNELSGDGYKYRGRGYIQLTGKNNYAQFDKFVDDDILGNPDLVATKYPLLSAAFWWDANNINRLADKGSCELVRSAVNRGVIGLEETTKLFNKFYEILNR